MKYLDAKVTRLVGDLYAERDKMLMKEIRALSSQEGLADGLEKSTE